jgi:hypothetical protein
MLRTLGLVTILLGLSAVLGCIGDPGKTKVAPIPESTETFARAAVEVGTIDVAHMADYEASVQRMSRDQQTRLWLSLKELHDGAHPSETPVVFDDEGGSGAGGGCDILKCSHSSGRCGSSMWCCAFGEDKTFYAPSSCPGGGE